MSDESTSRRGVLSILSGTLATTAMLGNVTARQRTGSGTPRRRIPFEKMYNIYRRYRDSDVQTRRRIVERLSDAELEALRDLVVPHTVAVYVSGDDQHSGPVLETEDGDLVTRTNRRQLRPDPIQKWGWDRSVAVETVRKDDAQLLSPEQRYTKVGDESQSTTVPSGSSLGGRTGGDLQSNYSLAQSSGYDSLSHTVSAENFGTGTAFEWEHSINWNYTIFEDEDRAEVTDYSATDTVEHTSLLVDYDRSVEDSQWLRTKTNNVGWTNENLISHKQVRFSQGADVIGLDNYTAYPESKLLGHAAGGGKVLESSVND